MNMSAADSTNVTPAAEIDDWPRRGCFVIVERVLKWFGILLVALILLGVTYQTLATQADYRSYAPRGQLFNINGHQMHIVCKGEGSPAVILQAGATAESLWWDRIQNQLAAHTRVCAYDRPGLGWSDPVDGPRDPLTIAGELHSLLEAAGIQAPYVLAGHSFGAVLTRIYAQQYPQDVAGIVMVDSQLIDAPFADQNAYDAWKSANNAIQVPVWVMWRTGLGRLLFSGQFAAAGFPPEIAPEIAALQARNMTFDTDYAERMHGMWAITQASASARDFGTMPVIVLWTPMPEALILSDSAQQAALARRDELNGLSTNSSVRIIEGSNHLSLLGNPEHAQQVADAILDVLDAAETGDRLVQ